MYFFWWQKPVDIDDPFVLRAADSDVLMDIVVADSEAMFPGETREVKSRVRNLATHQLFRIITGRFITSFSGEEDSSAIPIVTFHIGLLTTSGFYSGIHLLSWGSGALQGSRVSEVLWKVACLLVPPITLCVVLASLPAHPEKERSEDSEVCPILKWLGIIFGMVIATTLLLALSGFVVSRVYLQVEVLRGIPYVDPGVYKVPRWSAYWPHL